MLTFSRYLLPVHFCHKFRHFILNDFFVTFRLLLKCTHGKSASFTFFAFFVDFVWKHSDCIMSPMFSFLLLSICLSASLLLAVVWAVCSCFFFLTKTVLFRRWRTEYLRLVLAGNLLCYPPREQVSFPHLYVVSSDVDPLWSYADPDPNRDLDPGQWDHQIDFKPSFKVKKTNTSTL